MRHAAVPLLLVTILCAPAQADLSAKDFSNLKKRAKKAVKMEVWDEAAQAVTKLAGDDSPRAVDAVVEVGSSCPHPQVYEAACAGLAAMQGDAAVGKLVEALERGKRAERILLIDACARRSDARTAEGIIAALDAKEPEVQRTAVVAIKQRELMGAIDGLIDLLAEVEKEDQDGFAHVLIRETLTTLTRERFKTAEDWRNFWEPRKEGFQRPEPREAGDEPAGPVTTRVRPTFFGTELYSNRLVFVVDISGSMAESDPFIPRVRPERDRTTTGTPGRKRPTTGDGTGAGAPPPPPPLMPKRRADAPTCPSRVRIDRAKFQLSHAIDGLPEKAEFTIIAYSGLLMQAGLGYMMPEGTPAKGKLPIVIGGHQWLHVWKKKLAPATERNKKSAKKFVAALKAHGSTFTLRALRLALEVPDADTIVLLSDGSPTEIDGIEADRLKSAKDMLDELSSRNRFKRLRIDTFAVGTEDKVDFGQFMKDLAGVTRGSYTEVK